jgi:hypothetical protein
MKCVFAFGKQTETIFFAEFVQANSAIRAIFQAVNGGVRKNGKCVDESLFHACVVKMEELLQLAVESTYQLQLMASLLIRRIMVCTYP